ncbi:hypothetical protein HYALB_00005995 [Hymenoscyphus albidus]|uniref:Uncharacterized protein n=1 Tax=Hymenoscyphus albidus TaxID=595503 RepID=A0A9N9PVH5_9HELO|nr:hypothetical protein HYALB_00005995 [Hymenoscyphus albidus]
MSYKAYLTSTLGLPKNHHALFIETHATGPKTGFLYQVTGTIQHGMVFEHKHGMQPERRRDFGGLKEFLGVVTKEDFENGRVKEGVESVEPPKKQFEGGERLFPNEGLRRSQEWCGEVVGVLRGWGVISWE